MGPYMVQRKWYKSFGAKVKPFVMPPHRNPHTRKTVKKKRLLLLNYATEYTVEKSENNWNISREFLQQKVLYQQIA